MFDYTNDTGQFHEDTPLTPHPDGKAWPKCCRDNADGLSCAFVKDQGGGARLTNHDGDKKVFYGSEGELVQPKDVPFMCCHRTTDDGYYRVCAGWDACFGNKSKGARS